MFVYDFARKINSYRKTRKKVQSGRYLSPVRRIEKTAPLSTGRFVAMTFDDGPSAAQPNPASERFPSKNGLTDILLAILKEYDAKGTFDVIGTTEHNYPDRAGKENSFSWGGVKFDHYPEYGKDHLAGVRNQLNIARRMISEGHELANHGYRHILFGHIQFVYGKRVCFKSLGEVLQDLSQLHELVLNELNYKMRLARPPHYIDKIPHGASSYDAYRQMNYNYLAASFDGGGWKPTSGDYVEDVLNMVKPLQQALLSDPDSLNGQIIFQKDGYNMSRQTPVVDALGKCLALLKESGYRVVTASELLHNSPFEDINDTDSAFASVLKLDRAGYCIGYKNNTFQPDRVITKGELVMMLTPPEVMRSNILINDDIYSKHPYSQGIAWAAEQKWFKKLWNSGNRFNPDEPLKVNEFSLIRDIVSEGRGIKADGIIGFSTSNPLKRRDVIDFLALVLPGTN